MNVAEQKRNVPKILSLHVLNKLLKIPKKISNTNKDNCHNLIFYPPVKDMRIMADLLNRISWYLPRISKLGLNVKVASNIKVDKFNISFLEKHLENHYNSYFKEDVLNAINIVHDEFNQQLRSSDMILVWDKSALFQVNIIKNLSKVYIVDPTFYSHTESSMYREINYNLLPKKEKNQNINIYIERYQNLKQIATNFRDATVFGSGPSLEKSVNHDFSESFTIVCNSIVKNKTLLEHIKPNVIVFGDPVLHFSISNYSEEFRKHLVDAVKKYGAYCLVPENSADLIAMNMPDIADYIIGVPTNAKDITFLTPHNFKVKSSSNILTLLMLPIASGLFDTINIIGSDGRNKNEKTFWQHSKASQFNELMESVYKSHPSFFRDRIYTDYYKRHVNYLESLMVIGEQRGKKYHSLEFSHIKSLQERR
ncbi:hypothetical protein [Priestia flexa]|uniref:hypothetical protein n=1 Tax=Priestia flexa TaxID=86664 RepID=UPI001CD1BA8E|nr:hypothetical protein [Priestia flexa]MCA1202278.1 hypothetical protein [Priestia flexa]